MVPLPLDDLAVKMNQQLSDAYQSLDLLKAAYLIAAGVFS